MTGWLSRRPILCWEFYAVHGQEYRRHAGCLSVRRMADPLVACFAGSIHPQRLEPGLRYQDCYQPITSYCRRVNNIGIILCLHMDAPLLSGS
jgi:hypothetical protein